MSETIIRIFTESITPVTMVSELGLEVALTTIETLVGESHSSSSTLLAGLLQAGMTRPIDSAEDMRLATVIYTTNTRLLKWCNPGCNKTITKLLSKQIKSRLDHRK